MTLSPPCLVPVQDTWYPHTGPLPGVACTVMMAVNPRVLAAFAGPRGYSPIADVVAMKGDAYWVLGGLDRSIPAVRSAQLADSLIRALGQTRWQSLALCPGRPAARRVSSVAGLAGSGFSLGGGYRLFDHQPGSATALAKPAARSRRPARVPSA